MRVGIFHDGLEIPPKAGVPYRFYYLSKELQKQGIEIVLFLADRFCVDKEKLKETGFEYHIFSPKEFYEDYDLLKKVVSESKVDILQVDCSQATLWYGAKLSKELKLPLVTEMHDVDHVKVKSFGETNKLKLLELQFIQYTAGYLSDAVTCFTQLDFDQLTHLNIDPKKITLISNGIDSDYFYYSAPKTTDKTLIFLGNMHYLPNMKAAERIITKIMPQVDAKLICVGMVPDTFKDQYSSNKILFTGGVSDIRPWLQQASLAVAPVFEGSGMRIKYLNFAAAGIPVLTSSVAISGYPQEIAFIEDSIDNFASQVNYLLSHPEILLQQSKLARKIVEENYSWKELASKTIKLYKKTKYAEKKVYDKNIHCNCITTPSHKAKPLWLEDEERTQ